MICDKIKECAEKTKHISIPLKTSKQKGKNSQNRDRKENDIYQQPLDKSPCSDNEQQKKCIDFLDRRSLIKCEENGKAYILDQSKTSPRNEVIKYFIDKGVITEPEASNIYKCDNVLLIRDSRTAILVELKGGDTRHALRQISGTLSRREFQTLWDSQCRIFGRIICRSTPPRLQSTSEFLDVKETLFNRNGNLKIGEEYMVEMYDELERRK